MRNSVIKYCLLVKLILVISACSLNTTQIENEHDTRPAPKQIHALENTIIEAQPKKLPIRFNATGKINHPLVGHFWSVAEEKLVPWQQVIADIPTSGWLMLGELHDHIDHQKMESLFISILAKKNILGTVAMEQLRPDQQILLKPWYGKGNEITGDAINWKPKAWNWMGYRMPLQQALNNSPKVLAIDLSKDVIKDVYTNKVSVKKATTEHKALLAELINKSHRQETSNQHTHAMVQVQLAKDQFMAKQLTDNTLADKSNVMIAGMHHSRKDFGVPLWLEKSLAKTKIMTIVFMPVTANSNPKEYFPSQYKDRATADYIFFTPSKI